MASITFAFKWNELGDSSSRKQAKGEFYGCIYQQQSVNDTWTLEQFKNSYGKVVMYQNYLRELYNLVSIDSIFALVHDFSKCCHTVWFWDSTGQDLNLTIGISSLLTPI
jgi:hypothetical protein